MNSLFVQRNLTLLSKSKELSYGPERTHVKKDNVKWAWEDVCLQKDQVVGFATSLNLRIS